MGIALHRFESCSAHSAHIAQLVEHTLGKGEVTGSNPVVGFEVTRVVVSAGLRRDAIRTVYLNKYRIRITGDSERWQRRNTYEASRM